MNTSSQRPDAIMVDEARLFLLGRPAYAFFCAYFTGRAR